MIGVNGTLREKALIPALGSFGAYLASGAILSACIFLVALAGAPWYGPMTSPQWWLVGAFWRVLTLVSPWLAAKVLGER